MPVTSPRQLTAEDSNQVSFQSIPWPLRLVYCGLGLGLIGLLVVARMLEPDPSGLGTHQQLGLPPCGFEIAFGAPCPSCGMTTSWALATRGRWITSAQTNAGGFLLALFAGPLGVWLAASGYSGRWTISDPRPLIMGGLLAAVIATAIIQWIFRVWY